GSMNRGRSPPFPPIGRHVPTFARSLLGPRRTRYERDARADELAKLLDGNLRPRSKPTVGAADLDPNRGPAVSALGHERGSNPLLGPVHGDLDVLLPAAVGLDLHGVHLFRLDVTP